MTQSQRRVYLITALLNERASYDPRTIPSDEQEQIALLRALFNTRMPQPVSQTFLHVQDRYLQEEIRRKGVVSLSNLKPMQQNLYLWQGDITTLHCDAIVNAANQQMLGCFTPNHRCIDNAIHTFAGVQLRMACAQLMRNRPYEEAGRAQMTPAYNLPSRYIFHTVGPIVYGRPTQKDEELLASCYRSCLTLADQKGLKSLAFCCISTGEYHFPNDQAAEIAVGTVKSYKEQTQSAIKVIFNVFKNVDYQLYRNLLRKPEETTSQSSQS